MDDDGTASQPDLQMEDAGNDKSKQSYKSWKKKYRKMRDHFDRKMRESEELYRKEQKAIDTNKRIAIEIDRLLDLLLDINNSPQIPPDRRFDLSLPTIPKDMPGEPVLPIDQPRHQTPGEDDDNEPSARPEKSFAELLEKVPHHKYAAAARLFPDVVADLEAGTEGFPGASGDPAQASHPASFLTADDIDNYLWEADRRVARKHRDGSSRPPPPQLPTLAPKALTALQEANGNGNGVKKEERGAERSRAAAAAEEPMSAVSRDFALRNPTSVYNWLRKHAPKTFLQDGEASADKENGDDEHHGHHGGSGSHKERSSHEKAVTSSTRSRKSVGGSAAERRSSGAAKASSGSRRSSAAAGTHPRSKRSTARSSLSASMVAAELEDEAASVADHDEDDDNMSVDAVATPTTAKGSKRKRPADDDSGYRPKGGSSRPSKKKRQSAGGDGETTPTTVRASKPRRSHLSTAETFGDPSADDME